MENGRSNQIIERLTEIIENGPSAKLNAGKILVNKEEAVKLLNELKSIVDGELKIYRDVNDRKGKIITEAKKTAEEILKDADISASRIRVTKGSSAIIDKDVTVGLIKEDKMALRTAGDIYAASLIYTDEMLTEANDVVEHAYGVISQEYKNIIDSLEDKMKKISDNKAELMMNLKGLSEQERYEQILELGQLLSNELYYERKNAQEYKKNGSYQMQLNLNDGTDYYETNESSESFELSRESRDEN